MLNKKKEFFHKINKLENEEDIDSFLVYLLSPVITGIKPSATITVNNTQKRRLMKLYSEKLNFMGINYTILKSCSKRSLFFIYNINSLEKYLELDESKRFLEKEGYSGYSLEEMILKVKDKIKDEQFPHEIGLFLGIPVCDIEGFLSCKKCISSGYWKVYDRLEIANKIFSLYDSSRNLVIDNTLRGIPINSTIHSINNMYINSIDILQ